MSGRGREGKGREGKGREGTGYTVETKGRVVLKEFGVVGDHESGSLLKGWTSRRPRATCPPGGKGRGKAVKWDHLGRTSRPGGQASGAGGQGNSGGWHTT